MCTTPFDRAQRAVWEKKKVFLELNLYSLDIKNGSQPMEISINNSESYNVQRAPFYTSAARFTLFQSCRDKCYMSLLFFVSFSTCNSQQYILWIILVCNIINWLLEKKVTAEFVFSYIWNDCKTKDYYGWVCDIKSLKERREKISLSIK